MLSKTTRRVLRLGLAALTLMACGSTPPVFTPPTPVLTPPTPTVTSSPPPEVYISTWSGINVYAGDAAGSVSPIRQISGDQTGLNGSSALAFDLAGDLYTMGHYGIEEFPPTASGNVAPMRTIGGSQTQLGTVASLAVDTCGYIYALEPANPPFASGRILTFFSTASGNVAPFAILSGPNTNLDRAYRMAKAAANPNLYVVNNVNETIKQSSLVGWDISTVSGNTAPGFSLGGLDYAPAVAVASTPATEGDLFVQVDYQGTINVYPPASTTPVRVLHSPANSTTSLAVDGQGQLYVGVWDILNGPTPATIFVYAAGAQGRDAPVRTFSDPNLVALLGIAVPVPNPLVPQGNIQGPAPTGARPLAFQVRCL